MVFTFVFGEKIEIPNQDEDIGEEEDKDLKPLNWGVRQSEEGLLPSSSVKHVLMRTCC